MESLPTDLVASRSARVVPFKSGVQNGQVKFVGSDQGLFDINVITLSKLHILKLRRSIRKAMAMWEKASKRSLRLIDVSPPTLDSPLNYRRSSDIDIYFAKLDHGDLEGILVIIDIF
jgi:hypothetical protein